MMNHSRKATRIRKLRRWRDGILEHVSYLVVFALFVYLFFYIPLSNSMGW